MTRRKLGWLAGGVIVLVVAGGALATHSRFADVTDDHPVDAIEWAAEQGITTGYSATEFRPDEPLKRAHALVFMTRFYDNVLGADGDDQHSNPDFTRADMMALLYSMTAPATTTTTTTTQPAQACADAVCVVDHYWFGSGRDNSVDNYAVKFVVAQQCSSLYVEVQLLDSNSRRIGEWGNELLTNPAIGREFTVEVNYIDDWDSFARFEWEYTCR